MLRRIVAEAELLKAGATPEEAAAKAKQAKLKAKAADAAGGKDDSGEGGLRKKGKGAGKGGDDEDLTFDADEELEGEEVVSDDPGAEDVDESDDEDADMDFEWEPVGALEMPAVWPSHSTKKPGEEGFNKHAATCLAGARLGSESSPFAGLGMRLHQESAAFLMHPASPIQRLLVDHATGTGKTLIILRILDNYFDDPRPKVAIFPTERVCDGFYKELLKWPTRWRHYFSHLKPIDAGLASGAKDWRRKRTEVWDLNNDRIRFEAKTRGLRLERVIQELISAIRETLEMKTSLHRGKLKASFVEKILEESPNLPIPRAPLRAFRYTTAGGGAAELGDDGWPQSPLLKVGFDPAELNPYARKVVIMDECHNLVRPCSAYEEQLGRLRHFLSTAKGLVLAGFTGTPVGNEALEGRVLLDIIKGEEAAGYSDEGFVSSFHARASEDFPREVPVRGIPDGVIHEGLVEDLVKRHSMHGEALKRYILKEVEFQTIPRLLRLPPEKRTARLANYCNMHVHWGAYHGANRTGLLSDVKCYAPKFYAVAKAVAKCEERQEKCVVLLSREAGFKVMLEVLRHTAKSAGFRVATMEELSDFNDARRNLRGEKFRVLVAETTQAGEGTQFRHVRRLFLVDVPLRHSDLVQRCSRCVRLGGHAELPLEERSLAVELHVGQLPKFLRQGPGALIYRELLNAKDAGSMAGTALEAATEECLKELRRREVQTLPQLQAVLQRDDGEDLIELLTETALEQLGDSSSAPARPLAMALWRLRKGGDDLQHLEEALIRQGQQTADELLMEALFDKSSELLPPLEAMRMGAVDRPLLAHLGDPPRAPPPRTEAVRQRAERAQALLMQAADKKAKKVAKQAAREAKAAGHAAGTGSPSPQAEGAAADALASPGEAAELQCDAAMAVGGTELGDEAGAGAEEEAEEEAGLEGEGDEEEGEGDEEVEEEAEDIDDGAPDGDDVA